MMTTDFHPGRLRRDVNDSSHTHAPAQNTFAVATISCATVATIVMLVPLILACVWRDGRTATGRLLIALNLANLAYSISWIVYGVGHLAWEEESVLMAHRSAGNCAALAFNSGGLTGIVGGHTMLLGMSLHVLNFHRVVPKPLEVGFLALLAAVSIGVAVICYTTCTERCVNCDGADCPPSCTIVWEVFAYAWVGSLVVPLILGVVLAAKGSCLLRDRGVRPPKSQRNIDVQKVDRSELTFHFDQELFMNLWANVRYYPYMLLFLSVVYIVCGLTAAKVGAGKSPHVYTDAESRDALVVQTCWVVMALQSTAHAYIFLRSPRVRKQWKPDCPTSPNQLSDEERPLLDTAADPGGRDARYDAYDALLPGENYQNKGGRRGPSSWSESEGSVDSTYQFG